MTDLAPYIGLFFSAALAATLLPGSSEAVFVGLILAQKGDPWILLAVATIGNVLGSVINWLCGRLLLRFRDRKWFPVSPQLYDKAVGWFQRFGVWSLLLAWVPIVGDPLTVAAGALRVPLLPFAAIVTVGKFARYLAVFALLQS